MTAVRGRKRNPLPGFQVSIARPFEDQKGLISEEKYFGGNKAYGRKTLSISISDQKKTLRAAGREATWRGCRDGVDMERAHEGLG